MSDSAIILSLAMVTLFAVLAIAIYQLISVRRAQRTNEATVTERAAGAGHEAHKVGSNA